MIALLFISLLAILAGTLLLAKNKKEQLGSIFCFISWFFIAVGCILFIASIVGGICDLTHGRKSGRPCCPQELMMKDCKPGMPAGTCCPSGEGAPMSKDKCMKQGGCMQHGGMQHGCCMMPDCCMKHDSTMKMCPGNHPGDTAIMSCRKSKLEEITE